VVEGIWSHGPWVVALVLGLYLTRRVAKLCKAAAPAVGEGLRPHVVELADAIGERCLSSLARRISPSAVTTHTETSSDEIVTAQMQLDLAPTPRAYDRLAS
jgi:hypothetical protein